MWIKQCLKGLEDGVTANNTWSYQFHCFVFFCFLRCGFRPNHVFLQVYVSGCCLWTCHGSFVNPPHFSLGKFGWRCVQLSHSSSHPRPLLPCLPPSQLPLHSRHRCSSNADYTWRRATPPRLGNGQNSHWPTLLPQVRFNSCLSICLIYQATGYFRLYFSPFRVYSSN